jgi:hypothetical protein
MPTVVAWQTPLPLQTRPERDLLQWGTGATGSDTGQPTGIWGLEELEDEAVIDATQEKVETDCHAGALVIM